MSSDLKNLLRMDIQNKFTPEKFIEIIDETQTVPFQRFELFTSKFGQDCIYCFVEGRDLPYYSIRIEAIACIPCKFIDSGGKKNVIAINNLLRQKMEYSRYKTLYMVDKDYDDNSNLDKSIYVTPCYSVENFYQVNNIVDKLFCLLPDNPNYEPCVRYIDEQYQNFLSAISLFCSWYYSVKQFERTNNTILNINLNENINSHYIDYIVDENGISIKSDYNLENLNIDYNTNISQKEIETNLQYINKDNIRGKYLFQFLEKLLTYFNKDSNKKGPHKFLKQPLSINLDRKKMMTTLNSIAITPKGLKDYIQNNIT